MNILASSGLAVFLTSIITAVFVFVNNPKKQTHIAWGLFCFSVSMWGMGLFFGFIAQEYEVALFWGRFLNLSAIFIPIFFLHFVYALLDRIIDRKFLLYTFYSTSVIYFLFSLFYPLYFVRDVVTKLPFRFYPDAGLAYYFFPFLYTVIVLTGIIELFRAYVTASGQKRNQINYLFWGMAIGFLGGSTTFPYVFDIRIYPFGTWGVIAYVLLVAYAITKHRLMNISVVISRTLAWLLTVLFLGSIYTGFVWLYKTYINVQIDLAFWGWTILYGIFVGQTFQKIRLFLQTTTDKAFVKGWYDYRKVLRKVAAGLSKALTREDVVKIIYPILQDDIDVSATKIYFLDDSSKNYIEWNGGTGEPDPQSSIKPNIVQEDISPIDGHIAVPCFSGPDLLGVFVLGKKRSEDEYTDDDLEMFRTIAEYVAIALEYIVKPYEEVKEKFELTERRLVETEKQLERSQRLASLGTVAAGVAHEIRNPLAIIQLKTQNLPDSKELNEYKEAVSSNIERATSIIRQMLKLSKPKARSLSEIDLNQLVQETLQLFVISGVSLKKDLKQVPKIKADQNEIKQALINLIDNAVHAMPDGGELIIKTQYDKDTATVYLEISDTGQGIAPELREKIFDPFFSTRHEGVGLGLPIAYRIIREHGGTLELKSKMGKGTTFIISFPVSPD